MDPFVLGLVAVMGASAAMAARIRRLRRREGEADGHPRPQGGPAPPRTPVASDPDAVRVGDVLTYLSEEFWLAGELTLWREGVPALRLFSAPTRGADRWVALPRDGRSIWVLQTNGDLAAIGWPGVEVPTGGRLMRRFEYGPAAIAPTGEVATTWEGVGRFALFRGHDGVALVLEGPARERLALVGREIPRQLVEKMG
jgi:hypothetical protein